MLNFIDRFLNKITMYRLVLYYLIGLWVAGLILSITGVLPFDPAGYWLSLGVILASCWITNLVFAKVFKAQANIESFYITALILALIMTPLKGPDYTAGLSFFIWAPVWAMASKYILAIGKKHIFNPAAFAVALTALTLNQSASWWVGTMPMFIFVLIGGVLMVRKLQRSDLVVSYLIVALYMIVGSTILRGGDGLAVIGRAF